MDILAAKEDFYIILDRRNLGRVLDRPDSAQLTADVPSPTVQRLPKLGSRSRDFPLPPLFSLLSGRIHVL